MPPVQILGGTCPPCPIWIDAPVQEEDLKWTGSANITTWTGLGLEDTLKAAADNKAAWGKTIHSALVNLWSSRRLSWRCVAPKQSDDLRMLDRSDVSIYTLCDGN